MTHSLSEAPGAMRITAQEATLLGPSSNNVKNLLLYPLPTDTADFVVTTQMSFAPPDDSAQAGLLIYWSDDEYFSVTRTRQSLYLSYENGSGGELGNTPSPSGSTVYLRFTRAGKKARADWSLDGASWAKIGEETVLGQPFTTPRVGVFASGSSGSTTTLVADFNFLRVEATTP